jgi:hypothetical protein
MILYYVVQSGPSRERGAVVTSTEDSEIVQLVLAELVLAERNIGISQHRCGEPRLSHTPSDEPIDESHTFVGGSIHNDWKPSFLALRTSGIL